jgi:hypothetical protein
MKLSFIAGRFCRNCGTLAAASLLTDTSKSVSTWRCRRSRADAADVDQHLRRHFGIGLGAVGRAAKRMPSAPDRSPSL